MSDCEPPPPPVTALRDKKKLVVIEFLDAHLGNLGISQEGHRMLYRMVELISALGKEIHSIAQSPQHIVPCTVIQEMRLYAMCVMDGCKKCKKGFEGTLRAAQTAAAHLPDLEGDWEVEGESLKEKMMVWRDELRRLHIPTGNEGRLIRHLANHFFDVVFRDFFELHRRHPGNAIWELNELFTDIQSALEDIHHVCITADAIVEELEKDEVGARKKLQQWLEDRRERITTSFAPESQIESVVSTPRTARWIPSTPYTGDKAPATASVPESQIAPVVGTPRTARWLPSGPYTGDKAPATAPAPEWLIPQIPSVVSTPRTARWLPLTPYTGDKPPQLPPLPFQIPGGEGMEDPFATPPALHVEDTTSPLHVTQSFSAIEEQVTQRGHFRNPTVASPGYTADSSAASALVIARHNLRHPPVRSATVGSWRKESSSAVPRIFADLNELERGVHDLALHRVKTPEEKGILPFLFSPLAEVMCVGDSPPQQPQTSSVPSSPVPQMQRVWKVRIVNGEEVRYREQISQGDRMPASEPTADECSE